MKRADMLTMLTVLFWGFAVGAYTRAYLDQRHAAEPTAAVLDPRTIGAACTTSDFSGYDAGLLEEWRDKSGNLCATLYMHTDQNEFHTTFPSRMHEGTFVNEEDAVQWIESQPYRQGGAK